MGRERAQGQGQGEGGARQSARGRIYLLGADNKPVAHAVRLGITDGVSTELLVRPGDETLKEGANVITGVLGGAAGSANSAASQRQGGGPRPPF
jgi:HlyD family secretion protein